MQQTLVTSGMLASTHIYTALYCSVLMAYVSNRKNHMATIPPIPFSLCDRSKSKQQSEDETSRLEVQKCASHHSKASGSVTFWNGSQTCWWWASCGEPCSSLGRRQWRGVACSAPSSGHRPLQSALSGQTSVIPPASRHQPPGYLQKVLNRIYPKHFSAVNPYVWCFDKNFVDTIWFLGSWEFQLHPPRVFLSTRQGIKAMGIGCYLHILWKSQSWKLIGEILLSVGKWKIQCSYMMEEKEGQEKVIVTVDRWPLKKFSTKLPRSLLYPWGGILYQT